MSTPQQRAKQQRVVLHNLNPLVLAAAELYGARSAPVVVLDVLMVDGKPAAYREAKHTFQPPGFDPEAERRAQLDAIEQRIKENAENMRQLDAALRDCFNQGGVTCSE